MRAVRYTGGKLTDVELPAWVKLRVASDLVLWARCLRCDKAVGLAGPRADEERELGRFADWHRRCVDRAEAGRRPAVVATLPPSEGWMRAFERAKEGEGDA